MDPVHESDSLFQLMLLLLFSQLTKCTKRNRMPASPDFPPFHPEGHRRKVLMEDSSACLLARSPRSLYAAGRSGIHIYDNGHSLVFIFI